MVDSLVDSKDADWVEVVAASKDYSLDYQLAVNLVLMLVEYWESYSANRLGKNSVAWKVVF
jgi:hypothetical protein